MGVKMRVWVFEWVWLVEDKRVVVVTEVVG